jgi:hypothetical protein
VTGTKVPVTVKCDLCGTPKTAVEAGNGQAACPHCDRCADEHVSSTCPLQPCLTYEAERQGRISGQE